MAYFLDSIVQGGIAGYTDKHIYKNAEGLPACGFCGGVVTGCSLQHFAYCCPVIADLPDEAISSTWEIAKRGKGELDDENNKPLWLRGLPPLDVPDPLEPHYSFQSSYERLDVTGLVLAGDGSGGPHSRDFRARRCGFGLSIYDSAQRKLVGHASGSVPGRQTTPRAEALALLHALLTTVGRAVFVCDNLGVVNRYRRGRDNTTLKANGLLWSRILNASKRRSESGNGCLEVVWLPSHITHEAAIARGYDSAYWIANQVADKLAGQAAIGHQVKPCFLDGLADSTGLAISILGRLVAVLRHLADSDEIHTVGALAHAEPQVTKLDMITKLAKEARHALDANLKCVKCGLQVNLHRNKAYLEAVLHMRCLGCKGSLPQVTLHTKAMEDGAEDFQHYSFHGLSVHKTHTMATHGLLQLHFCTYCGAYGKARAYHLKDPCPPNPSKGGKQALGMLDRDVHPGRRKGTSRKGQLHPEVGPNRKCSFGKLQKAKAAYKRRRDGLLVDKKVKRYAPKKSSSGGPSKSPDLDGPTQEPFQMECGASAAFDTSPIGAERRLKKPRLDTVDARPTTDTEPKSGPLLDSIECARCWPLGAAALGYCICDDLDIVSAGPALSRLAKARVSPESSVEQCMPAHINESQDIPGSSAASSRSVPVDSVGCPRCWPLGASELGYCICDDLALVDVSPPSVGRRRGSC